MSNQSIIEHRANMYYVEFREDYLALCLACTYKKAMKGQAKGKASPYCKTLILAIAESWTNEKRGHRQDLTFYMTYPQWSEAMYGMFGRSVVIDSIDELIGEKLLRREPYKLYGKDTYRYALNYTEVNRRMKTLADRAPSFNSPQINAFTNKRVADLLVNEDPSTSKRNRESSQNQLIESSQRGNHRDEFDSVRNSLTYAPDPALSEHVDDAIVVRDGALQTAEHADSYSHTLVEANVQARTESTSLVAHHSTIALSTSTQGTPARNNGATNPESATFPTQTLYYPQRTADVVPLQQQRVKNTGKALSRPAPLHLTEQGQLVYAAWCSLFKSPPRATDKMILCANALHPILEPWCQALGRTCAQLLDEIQQWMYATDTRGFYQRGVSLCDIERDFEKWQSAMTHAATGMRAQATIHRS